MFNFDYSYLSLPKRFYSKTKPSINNLSEIFISNHKLYNDLNIIYNEEKLIDELLKKKYYEKSFSQAYAGHQFGHFTKLGDGRAIILGEHITNQNKRFDIQLKGGGKTKYSRNGDGKATLGSMLKEYLISEVMHHLKIPTSRCLALIKTGEIINRELEEDGSILVRVMKSHLRIGTFQYAAYFGLSNDLKKITSYSIKRLYPKIETSENPALELLEIVMKQQIDLVINWMRVGFIHGVMNTDNTSITGESFDYGPCAFINSYDPFKVYSSIDYNGRYAFGNQPNIIKWNILRFAEALLPIINQNKKISIQMAQSVVDKFDKIWMKKYYSMMLKKIGIKKCKKNLHTLIDELLTIMKKQKLDYNNTFYLLSQKNKNSFINHNDDFKNWITKWETFLKTNTSEQDAKNLMEKYNPVVIPRNHMVDHAIKEATNGNITPYEKLLEVLSRPYNYNNSMIEFMNPPSENFEKCFQTFCGT